MSATANELAQAQALIDVGRAEEAAAILARALAADPANARGWCMLGNVHLLEGRPRNALEAARRAMAIDPESEWAHRIASIANVRLQYHKKAIESARESVRLAPNIALAHAQLSLALAHGGIRHWRASAREAEVAVGLGPNDSTVHFIAGLAALRRHQRRAAERHYLRVLEFDPGHAEALTNLSVARLRRGRVFSAADGFGSAAGLDPKNDLHRRNIDAAVGRLLTRGFRIVLVIAGLAVLNHRFAAVIVLLPVAGVVAVVRARRTLSRATWAYARRVPFRNPRIAYLGAIVLVVSALLAPVPFVGPATADSLVAAAFFPAFIALVTSTIYRFSNWM